MDAKQITPNIFFGFPQPILEALDREIQYIDRIVDRKLPHNPATVSKLAEQAARLVDREGCKCENNGDWCAYCEAYHDYLDEDPEFWEWSVDETYPDDILDSTGQGVATVCGQFENVSDPSSLDPLAARRARLIAAAPELLAALKALLDVSNFATNSREGEIHLRAMAAIRKATER